MKVECRSYPLSSLKVVVMLSNHAILRLRKINRFLCPEGVASRSWICNRKEAVSQVPRFFRQVPRMARLFLQQTINFFGQRKIWIG